MSKEFEKIEPTFDGFSDSKIYQSPNQKTEQSKSTSFFKKVLKIIGGLVLIFGVMLFSGIGKLLGKGSGETSPQPVPVHELVKLAVQNGNKQLPMSVGEGVTLIGVNEGDGNKVIYTYEIRGSFVLDEKFLSLQTQQLKREYCGGKMKSFPDNGISARWEYKHGSKKYTITQTPSECVR